MNLQQAWNVRKFAWFLKYRVPAKKFFYNRVVDCIEGDPMDYLSLKPKLECGTACAYGYLPVCFPKVFEYGWRGSSWGSSRSSSETVVAGIAQEANGMHTDGMNAAEDFFGLDYETLYRIFFRANDRPGEEYSRVTKAQVANWLLDAAKQAPTEGRLLSWLRRTKLL